MLRRRNSPHIWPLRPRRLRREPPPELTRRQREVLCLIAEGFSTRRIARELGLSPKTVECYRVQLYEACGVDTPVALARIAYRLGWVEP